MAIVSTILGLATGGAVALLFQIDAVREFHKSELIWMINMMATALFAAVLTTAGIATLTQKGGKK